LDGDPEGQRALTTRYPLVICLLQLNCELINQGRM
jgi:hypothetical protein